MIFTLSSASAYQPLRGDHRGYTNMQIKCQLRLLQAHMCLRWSARPISYTCKSKLPKQWNVILQYVCNIKKQFDYEMGTHLARQQHRNRNIPVHFLPPSPLKRNLSLLLSFLQKYTHIDFVTQLNAKLKQLPNFCPFFSVYYCDTNKRVTWRRPGSEVIQFVQW